jgi:hypothetical protein
MATRYDIRAGAAENEWMVIDTATGEPVTVNDVKLIALQLEDADDLADLLNRIDANRPLVLS